MTGKVSLPVLGNTAGTVPRITSLLIKPASSVCNLDCAYCFYLDRAADPYASMPARRMTLDTLERLVDTYLFYSYPASALVFQGGEPTLAGVEFFEKLIEFEQRFGRNGQAVSNAMQTNGILLDDRWCRLFREFHWLLGISLDGPQPLHDRYRVNKGGAGSWTQVMAGLECLQRNQIEFNVLCVVSAANVEHAGEVYRFFRGNGIEHLQYIPLAEFDPDGRPLPFTITPEAYGRFLCETFDLWWPERRKVRVRNFDTLAEALAGHRPNDCTLHETCDSYAVVEYTGDVYPCDFFVEEKWKLGNVHLDSWPEIARRQRRFDFAGKKTLLHDDCRRCEYVEICRGGCPKHRHDPHANFADLDYFCAAYKMVFAKTLAPLKQDVEQLLRTTVRR